MLKNSNVQNANDPDFLAQLNTNITTSYVFTAFLAILIIFVIKSLIN